MMKNSQGQTPLCSACSQFAHPSIISKWIRTNPGDINVPDNDGVTPLHHTFLFGHKSNKRPVPHLEQSMELLIKHGASVNAEDNSGKTILQTIMSFTFHKSHHKMQRDALYNFRYRLINMLLKNGAKVCSDSGNSAWGLVKNLNEAKLLLTSDPTKINQLDKSGMTPLHQVLISNQSCQVEVLKYLLENGGDVKEGIDIIMLAKKHCHDFSVIEILLQRFPNYDINTRDSEGKTLLMSHGRTIDIVNKLLNLGADPKLHCNKGNTALVQCIYDCKAMKKLLELGVDPMKYSNLNNSPIVNAMLDIASSCNAMNHINFPPRFEVFNLILSSPQVKNNVSSTKVIKMYLYILNDFMFDLEMYMKLCMNSKDILSCIFQHNKQIVTTVFHHKIPKIGKISFSKAQFEMFGHAIVKLMSIGRENACESYFEYLKELVLSMLDTYPVLNPNPEIQSGKCISPIAVLLLAILFKNEDYSDIEDDDFDWTDIYNESDLHYHKEERFILFKEMLNRGTNINSMVLKISKHNSQYDLNKLKSDLNIPDALLVAFLLKRKRYVEELLPHWWGPPVALLLFCQCGEEIEFWLPLLMKFGGIPHNLAIFETFKNHMKQFVGNLELFIKDYRNHGFNKSICLAWQELKEQLCSPNLQFMSMYAVRRVFFNQASYPDLNLPKLLQDQVPPLLRPIVCRHFAAVENDMMVE